MNALHSRYLPYFFLLFFASQIAAQHNGDVHYITKTGYLGSDYYTEKASLWQEEVKKPNASSKAWFNYYLASDYSFIGTDTKPEEKRSQLKKILAGLQQAHPESFERWILEGRFYYDKPEPVLNAMRMKPDAPEPYRTLLRYKALDGDKDKFREYSKKLYETATIHPGLMDYNYNVLMSVAQNGVLFTNGDNDTYPVWILQEAKAIRRDVTILNVHLAKAYPDYLNRHLKQAGISPLGEDVSNLTPAAFIARLCDHINPQRAVFLAATVHESITDPIKHKLYSIGLVYRYSQKRFDNLAETRKNWKQKYRLNSLINSWYTESHISANLVDQLNMNYLPPALSLAAFARKNGQLKEADRLTSLAKALAEKAGQIDDFQNYLNEQSNE
ncbi:MAG: hypothetical protein AAFP70_00820 [Calditrichota bacterium]